jgi:hypothetical protein
MDLSPKKYADYHFISAIMWLIFGYYAEKVNIIFTGKKFCSYPPFFSGGIGHLCCSVKIHPLEPHKLFSKIYHPAPLLFNNPL